PRTRPGPDALTAPRLGGIRPRREATPARRPAIRNGCKHQPAGGRFTTGELVEVRRGNGRHVHVPATSPGWSVPSRIWRPSRWLPAEPSRHQDAHLDPKGRGCPALSWIPGIVRGWADPEVPASVPLNSNAMPVGGR